MLPRGEIFPFRADPFIDGGKRQIWQLLLKCILNSCCVVFGGETTIILNWWKNCGYIAWNLTGAKLFTKLCKILQTHEVRLMHLHHLIWLYPGILVSQVVYCFCFPIFSICAYACSFFTFFLSVALVDICVKVFVSEFLRHYQGLLMDLRQLGVYVTTPTGDLVNIFCSDLFFRHSTRLSAGALKM